MMVKPLHLVVGLLILFAAFWMLEIKQSDSLESFASRLDDHQEQIILEGCKRGNIRTAYELANHDPHRAELAAKLLPIVNCKKTSLRGHYTPVNLSVQTRYVQIIVNRERWPQINLQGQIVGTIPLPSAEQKP